MSVPLPGRQLRAREASLDPAPSPPALCWELEGNVFLGSWQQRRGREPQECAHSQSEVAVLALQSWQEMGSVCEVRGRSQGIQSWQLQVTYFGRKRVMDSKEI